MVKPGRLVAGKLAGIGTAVALVALAAYLAKRYNVGAGIIQSFQGAGEVAGSAIFSPVLGLVKGSTQQIGAFAVELSNIQENFNRFLAGKPFLSDAEKKAREFFTPAGSGTSITPGGTSQTGQDFTPAVIKGGTDAGRDTTSISSKEQKIPQPVAQLDLGKILNNAAIARRIETTRKAAVISPKTTSFGGFGSAEAQETALQKAIRESAAKFPQFFKNAPTISGQFTQKIDAFGRPIRSF